MDIERRRFLRGRRAPAKRPLRPPCAAEEQRFVAVCTRCDACRSACPTGIVREGVGGYPELVFGERECTFCGACVAACPSGALERGMPVKLRARARLSRDCVVHRHVLCRACAEACGAAAIRFERTSGRLPVPRLAGEACCGCGACVPVCPASAIDIVDHDMPLADRTP